MKNKILLLLLVASFSPAFAQSEQSLKDSANKMFAATYDFDFDTVLGLTYSKVFESVGKDDMKSAMESLFRNPMMSITFLNRQPAFTATPVKTIDGKKFSVIRYRNALEMKMTQTVDPETAKGMIAGLKQSGQYQQVTFDTAKNAFHIEGDAVLVAVSDASTNGQWQFVNYDNQDMFSLVFNENIKKELGL